MSGMMLHGLGDCTPELNCGCIGKPQDVLRERIELVTEGGRVWVKVNGVDIAGHVLEDRLWIRFEEGVPIMRVEMVGDLTAILGSAKFEVVKAEEGDE